MGFLGNDNPRKKNSLAARTRRAEAKAKKLQAKADLKARLNKALSAIKKLSK